MSSLHSEIYSSDIKQTTHALLRDERTYWSENPDQNDVLIGKNMDEDRSVFLRLLHMLIATRNQSDQQFAAKTAPQIWNVLDQTQLFANLDNPDIVVTKGHIGTTPLQHTKNVLAALQTYPHGNYLDRIALRLSAVYHDIGKSVSAGIPRDELPQFVGEPFKHSHPSHAEVSALAVQGIVKDPEIQQFFRQFDPHGYFWQAFIKIVAHHHAFEDPKLTKLQAGSEKLPQEVLALSTYEAWLIIQFMFADMWSNPKYHEYWPEKIEIFRFYAKNLNADKG